MDENESTPQVYISSSPFYKSKIMWIFLLILLLIPISFYIYKNYFAKTPITQPEKIILSCPVPKEYCNGGKEIIFEGTQALEFTLPNSTSITAPELIVDYTTSSTTLDKTKFKVVYLSTILTETCYAIILYLPQNSTLTKIDLLPLKKGEVIVTASGKLVVQLQKRVLDPNTLDQPDYIRCPVTNLQQKDLGEYLQAKEIKFE